jgi:putative tryptophan/tyrosine transport system substrate-binding protein
VNRRGFIKLLGGAPAAFPLGARAQQGDRMRRVGLLIQFAESDPDGQARVVAFREELQKLGWSIGGNLQIDYRWAVSNEERARSAAAELLELKPDVISANSTIPLRAAQQATRTVPIVFTTIIEPIGQGFVGSLAHPGGNTTGFSYLEVSIGGKWMNLLKEIAPQITRVACMFNPQRGPYSVEIAHFAQEAAQRHGVQYVAAPLFEPTQIEAAITKLADEPNGGLIISPDAFTVTHRQQIINLAARYRLPAIYSERNFAIDGGLVSYGPDYVEHWRQAASYVDRLLRGAKPADLPVHQPSKFYLVINLKAAKALGVDVPATLLAIADEVIELAIHPIIR